MNLAQAIDPVTFRLSLERVAAGEGPTPIGYRPPPILRVVEHHKEDGAPQGKVSSPGTSTMYAQGRTVVATLKQLGAAVSIEQLLAALPGRRRKSTLVMLAHLVSRGLVRRTGDGRSRRYRAVRGPAV